MNYFYFTSVEDQAHREAQREYQKQMSNKKEKTNMTWDDMMKNRSQVQPTNASRRVLSNTKQPRDKPFKLSK